MTRTVAHPAASIIVFLLLAAIPSCDIDRGLKSGLPAEDAGAGSGDLVATFIDVWQGDAALFELPDGSTLLIDGGDQGYGASTVAPLLEAKGIDVIDLMVLTHPHSDHCGGLDEVMERVDVLEIWDNGEDGDSYSWDEYEEARDNEGATVLVPPVGLVRQFGQVSLEVLHADSGHEGENNDSLVLMMTHGQVSFLLTGDVESEGQEEMVTLHGSSLRCDVLKVPHHGSWNQYEQFAFHAHPAFAVISSGEGNEYGHPHQETLDLYEGLGSSLCRTDTLGDVEITTDGIDVFSTCN